jgi:hypothetical protein
LYGKSNRNPFYQPVVFSCWLNMWEQRIDAEFPDP